MIKHGKAIILVGNDGNRVVGHISGQDLAGVLQGHVDGAESSNRSAGNLARNLHLRMKHVVTIEW